MLTLLYALEIIPKNIFFKENTSIGYGRIFTPAKIPKYLLENTMIGPFVFITTEAFSYSKKNLISPHSGHADNVYIGSNVRIGAHAIILPGSKIGDGSSIGAGSVVTCEVPSKTIFAGTLQSL